MWQVCPAAVPRPARLTTSRGTLAWEPSPPRAPAASPGVWPRSPPARGRGWARGWALAALLGSAGMGAWHPPSSRANPPIPAPSSGRGFLCFLHGFQAPSGVGSGETSGAGNGIGNWAGWVQGRDGLSKIMAVSHRSAPTSPCLFAALGTAPCRLSQTGSSNNHTPRAGTAAGQPPSGSGMFPPCPAMSKPSASPLQLPSHCPPSSADPSRVPTAPAMDPAAGAMGSSAPGWALPFSMASGDVSTCL